MPTTGIQAYEPFPITVKTGDPSLDESFLLQYGLTWRWKISIHTSTFFQRNRVVAELKPESLQPSSVQYSNTPGWLTIEVSIARGKDPVPLPLKHAGRVTIQRSETIGIIRSFGGMETTTFLVALVAAVVSGIGTFYAKNPTFGSLQDYLALVSWGLAIDLGKSVISK